MEYARGRHVCLGVEDWRWRRLKIQNNVMEVDVVVLMDVNRCCFVSAGHRAFQRPGFSGLLFPPPSRIHHSTTTTYRKSRCIAQKMRLLPLYFSVISKEQQRAPRTQKGSTPKRFELLLPKEMPEIRSSRASR